jgi:hypothetical protein
MGRCSARHGRGAIGASAAVAGSHRCVGAQSDGIRARRCRWLIAGDSRARIDAIADTARASVRAARVRRRIRARTEVAGPRRRIRAPRARVQTDRRRWLIAGDSRAGIAVARAARAAMSAQVVGARVATSSVRAGAGLRAGLQRHRIDARRRRRMDALDRATGIVSGARAALAPIFALNVIVGIHARALAAFSNRQAHAQRIRIQANVRGRRIAPTVAAAIAVIEVREPVEVIASAEEQESHERAARPAWPCARRRPRPRPQLRLRAIGHVNH